MVFNGDLAVTEVNQAPSHFLLIKSSSASLWGVPCCPPLMPSFSQQLHEAGFSVVFINSFTVLKQYPASSILFFFIHLPTCFSPHSLPWAIKRLRRTAAWA